MITIYKPEDLNPAWDIEKDFNTSNEDLWDFPLIEVDYLIETKDNGNFVLFNDRLYEVIDERTRK